MRVNYPDRSGTVLSCHIDVLSGYTGLLTRGISPASWGWLACERVGGSVYSRIEMPNIGSRLCEIVSRQNIWTFDVCILMWTDHGCWLDCGLKY